MNIVFELVLVSAPTALMSVAGLCIAIHYCRRRRNAGHHRPEMLKSLEGRSIGLAESDQWLTWPQEDGSMSSIVSATDTAALTQVVAIAAIGVSPIAVFTAYWGALVGVPVGSFVFQGRRGFHAIPNTDKGHVG